MAVNDNVSAATVLSGTSGTVTFDNTGATRQAGEPDVGGDSSLGTVWFAYTPTITGAFAFTTQNTPLPAWDSYLELFTGTNPSDFSTFTSIAGDDDGAMQPGATDSFGTSKVHATLTAGVTYYVQVSWYDDVSGPAERTDLVLAWGPYSPPPPAPTASYWTSPGVRGFHVLLEGDDVTLNGTHLDVLDSVTIGGFPQPFTVVSAAQIVVHVTSTARSGHIVVANTTGSSTAIDPASVWFAGPWLSSTDQWSTSRPLPKATAVSMLRRWLLDITVDDDPGKSRTGSDMTSQAGAEISGGFGPGNSYSYDGPFQSECAAAVMFDLTNAIPDLDFRTPDFPPGALDAEFESPAGSNPTRVRGSLDLNYLMMQDYRQDMPAPAFPSSWDQHYDVHRLLSYNYDAAQSFPASTSTPPLPVVDTQPEPTDLGPLLGSYRAIAGFDPTGTHQPLGDANPKDTGGQWNYTWQGGWTFPYPGDNYDGGVQNDVFELPISTFDVDHTRLAVLIHRRDYHSAYEALEAGELYLFASAEISRVRWSVLFTPPRHRFYYETPQVVTGWHVGSVAW